MHKSLTRRLLALLKLEKDIGVRRKKASVNTGSGKKDPHAWSREKQLYSEIEVNRTLSPSEQIGRTSSKNGKSKGKIK